MGGVVVNGLGVHRAYDADVIRDLRDIAKDFADLLTRLAVAEKLELGSAASQFLALQLSNGLTLGETVRHGLTLPLGQHWLVVEALQVRGTARHIEEDDSLGLWS